jgi:hypothetical protein
MLKLFESYFGWMVFGRVIRRIFELKNQDWWLGILGVRNEAF